MRKHFLVPFLSSLALALPITIIGANSCSCKNKNNDLHINIDQDIDTNKNGFDSILNSVENKSIIQDKKVITEKEISSLGQDKKLFWLDIVCTFARTKQHFQYQAKEKIFTINTKQIKLDDFKYGVNQDKKIAFQYNSIQTPSQMYQNYIIVEE